MSRGRSWQWRMLSRSMLTPDAQCVGCGSVEDLTLDHIIPIARGGLDTRLNAQVLCRSCNGRKADRRPVVIQLEVTW